MEQGGILEQLEHADLEVDSAWLPGPPVIEKRVVSEHAESEFAQDVRGLLEGPQGEMIHRFKLMPLW